ncbi:hypothetical protein KX928_01535 [Roseobacter sp. YSTF-M11]|uniref:Uncharacterized protein n=1 Tax=Roseobacter insulae TaxID=2859783 RepID=A0A9X1JWZ8_9RHOB|nr:hypothetical protein [Roseobacter insulae]MBW4706456.1 hypothetical protein [Roseobacter insulae]
MRKDWERNCLMSMAAKRKRKGLSRAEAIRDIETILCGFSTRFHISRAVSATYNGPSGEY